MDENGNQNHVESYGVLLYYKYTSIPDVASLARFYDINCQSLDLLGRIRIGFDGVNVTIGGKFPALKQHISLMRSNSLFDGTDFKLAQCGHPSNENIARDCGFTTLSVRVVKELVTFRSDPLLKSPDILNAGKHLSATEFHYVLHQADKGNALDCQAKLHVEDLVLLDARNVYETRIGQFKTANINALDPEIRQYSDLPSWIDKHSDRLRNKNVLMYCTGGIRCEMASAYIRSKGPGFENVFQLFGGIQRYLDQFPDGGYFKGKNFVFDHRISVGSCNMEVLGTCLFCGFPFDDYSFRSRCSYCRMLVLVCCRCQGIYTARYVCELCQKQGIGKNPISHESFDAAADETEAETSQDSDQRPHLQLSSRSAFYQRNKLRILCLHGFRQNASNFKGRSSSLSKKLKNCVDFVFVDAPHELPLVYRPTASRYDHNSPSPPENCRRKLAWLISPTSSSSPLSPDVDTWIAADQRFDPLQYKLQTDGFDESYSYLQDLISRSGPFDGILGFSQGAAMAALYCEMQQRRRGRVSDIRFAVLCSGYPAGLSESMDGFIECPSLHVYGGGGGGGRDRQIGSDDSRKLAALFDKNSSMTIEHDMGHIIPTKSPYVEQIKAFFMSFF